MTEFDYGSFKVVEVQRDDPKTDPSQYELHLFGDYLLGPTGYTTASYVARLLAKLATQEQIDDNAALPKRTGNLMRRR